MEDAKSNIYVFGGAQQDSNLNSIQVLKDGKFLPITLLIINLDILKH